MGMYDADLAAFLEREARRLGVPGAAVGVTHRGVDTVAVTGVTSLDDPLPVTDDTLFMIGSTSKTFTATLAMSLVEQGLLDLDAPLHRYLPEVLSCPPDLRELRATIKVVDLFTHTAGWVGDGGFDTGPGDDAFERAAREQLATVPQHTAPGERPSYNNLSLVIAARLIETVTESSYETLLRERVLEPLSLDATYLFPHEIANRRHAAGHLVIDGEQRTIPDWPLPRCFTPTGGILSTVHDQLAWARFHLGVDDGAAPPIAAAPPITAAPPISAEMRAAMRTPRATMNPAFDVGINWLLRRRHGRRLVAHGGNVSYQQLSAFAMIPEEQFAVTTLTNARAGEELGRLVLDWCLERFLGVTPVPLPAAAQPDLAEYVGEYGTGDAFLSLTVGEDGTLRCQQRYPEAPVFDGSQHGLYFTAPDIVTTHDDPAEPAGVFLRDGVGRIDALRFGVRVGNRLADQ